MESPQTNPAAAGINPAQILPKDWDLDHDVLMIIGEDAGAIAAPFAAHGAARVIAMFPSGVPTERVDSGVIAATSRQELVDAVMLFAGEDPSKWAMIRTPRCSLNHDATQGMNQVLAHAVKLRKANKQAVHHLAPLWAKNGFKNLPRVAEHPLVNDVGSRLTGVPLIVVGAGPSLGKNIETLRQAKGRAIILCVNRALRSLQNAGIAPDLAINVEPQDVSCQFEGIDTASLKGLILSVTSHPPLYDLETPTILSFAGNEESDAWMFVDPVELVPAGGSVSCSALSLGLMWGCDPIVMVGQDLSFPGGAYYHADGADGDAKAVYNDDAGIWQLEGHSEELRDTLMKRTGDGVIRFHGTQVPGYFGGTVPTSSDFATFRTWFQHAVGDNPNTRFFNCTEGGARIDGMTHEPLAAVIAKLPERDLDLERIFKEDDIQAKVHHREARMKAHGKEIRTGLQRAVRQARKCVELIDASARKPQALQRLQKAESELKKVTQKVKVLSLMDQAKIQEAVRLGQTATTMQESLAAARALYQFIVDDGQRLLR
jgi:hypothetical protein